MFYSGALYVWYGFGGIQLNLHTNNHNLKIQCISDHLNQNNESNNKLFSPTEHNYMLLVRAGGQHQNIHKQF